MPTTTTLPAWLLDIEQQYSQYLFTYFGLKFIVVQSVVTFMHSVFVFGLQNITFLKCIVVVFVVVAAPHHHSRIKTIFKTKINSLLFQMATEFDFFKAPLPP